MTDWAKRIWNHPWIVAATNMLLLMALYTLTRLFFIAVNTALFPPIHSAHLFEMLAGGLRFDLTAVLYLSALYLIVQLLPLPIKWRTNGIWQRIAKWIFLVPNIIGHAINCIDIIYVRFTDRRTTITFFTEFQNESNIARIFFTGLVQYWYVTLFFLLTTAAFIYFTRTNQPDQRRSDWRYFLRESIIFLLSIYFVIIGIRGGFGAWTRPITLSHALQYTNAPQEASIVLNTPFSIMRSTEGQTYTNPHYFDDATLDNFMSPVHIPTAHTTPSNRNVVIIILESFSTEYLRDGYTPFLDSLCAHSTTYRHSFASGRKSIDAMPSVLSSIPMLIAPYVVTPYSTNVISSVAACLQHKGYTTAFFHGAPNGSMGFQAYARSAGFEHYFGKNEYDGPPAFDGTWAIWDEEFLQYFARTMNSLPQPFCTAVFTASSHHPFRVPERYEDTFPKGMLPIHQCVGYSDHALRLFFDYAQTQPWYSNTLFVLTADHTNQLAHPEDQTAKGLFEVPIIFFDPQRTTAQTYDIPVSQTDIMPSILAYLGYNEPFFAFGEDALTSPKQHPFAICYNTNTFQLISDRYLLQFDGKQLTAIYDHQADPLLQSNLLDELQDDADIQIMLNYLKAYIQQYISRMIDNRLTI